VQTVPNHRLRVYNQIKIKIVWKRYRVVKSCIGFEKAAKGRLACGSPLCRVRVEKLWDLQELGLSPGGQEFQLEALQLNRGAALRQLITTCYNPVRICCREFSYSLDDSGSFEISEIDWR
jgi:hypothetical protein